MNPSSSSELPSLQEPDVIASTKSSTHVICNEMKSTQPVSDFTAPVAPPRRKKKSKAFLQKNLESLQSNSSSSCTLCKVYNLLIDSMFYQFLKNYVIRIFFLGGHFHS